ncbi:hypothetical protein RWH43_00880 [Microbacterium sp. KSW2-21]|uniref:Uncharacterized protein n=1 Tax=Microbacterium algihabitans TaxID=3075992 RepID=A0ABU3RS42_9MICO|nr:hypothetical protein [Microbacterium sp. KSW2-21]MDU0325298.1 hypothetical protein [Microbacterium sp. KSW2-21]
MLPALIGLAFALWISLVLMLTGAVRSARSRGVARGRLFDRVALPWTIAGLALLVVVVVGCVLVFA